MRLVLVHGRSQGHKSEEQLRDEWLPAINKGLAGIGKPGLPDSVDIQMPFYGAELDRLVKNPPEGQFVTRGDDQAKPDPVEAELLLSMATAAGIKDSDIAAALNRDYVERGPQNWEWVHAAGRLLAQRVPWLSDHLLSAYIRDVGAYLTAPAVATAVNNIVIPSIEGTNSDRRVVVVGHSLGSVVTYNVLTRLRDTVQVPLFMTLGSPLGIPVVKRYLPRPLGMPLGVRKWFNGADERDYVALYARLDRDVFPADIENASDINNPRDNAHGIVGYLADATVATRLYDAVTA